MAFGGDPFTTYDTWDDPPSRGADCEVTSTLPGWRGGLHVARRVPLLWPSPVQPVGCFQK